MNGRREKKINGSEMIGERRWADSPAVADLIATLVEMGLQVDPTPKRGVDWPSPNRAVRDRFHALWTARMQQRCGVNPLKQPKTDGNMDRNLKSQQAMIEVAGLYNEGLTILEIAKRVGNRPERVRGLLERQGIKVRKSQDPTRRVVRGTQPMYYAEP